MKNRYTPYGYEMKNGKYIPVKDEAEIIVTIFADYISGKSLKTIADELTENSVEYLPDKSIWNKNRVSRMLCDNRYLGTELYPQIIDEEIFSSAQKTKGSRNTQKECARETIISSAVVPILCGECGYKLRRINDKRYSFQQKRICDNCKSVYRISDQCFAEMITNLLKSYEKLEPETESDDMEIKRLEKELSRNIVNPEFTNDRLRKMVYSLASVKYSHNRKNYKTIRTDFNNPSFTITRYNIGKYISSITIKSCDEIIIKTICGKELTNGESC